MKTGIIERLLRYRLRKMLNGKEPTKIVLNWKHMKAIEAWVIRCDLRIDILRTIVGYQILGMTIIDTGE